VKGEILDVEAFQEALGHRAQITAQLHKTNQRKISL